MEKQVTILRGEPIIIPIAEMSLSPLGVEQMMEWVETHRPACLPEKAEGELNNWKQLFPHDLVEYTPPVALDAAGLGLEIHCQTARPLTSNELLVELAGRKCYDSFGLKAGKKSNREYIANTQSGDIPHSSIMYHAKMSFFFAGISRRVSHEIIRNYVGADRDEEGSPSQESTRFTHHYGFFIEPPRYGALEDQAYKEQMQQLFGMSMQDVYDRYTEAIDIECRAWLRIHGKMPTSIDKKRIYEAASSFLPHQAETSFIWTTNPSAIAKFVRERNNPAADLEIQRFAEKWRRICMERWPNLFPQPWMS